MTEILPIKDLVNSALNLFELSFGSYPDIAVSAPGRVNLIGEHTDYNDGFVLPMALPLVTVIVGRKSTDDKTRCSVITSTATKDIGSVKISFLVPSVSQPLVPSEPLWSNYIKGVVTNFHDAVCGFEAAIVSSVPLGGGLSSSASLEVAMYTFLEELMNSKALSLRMKALACQKAEHDFAGVPCGIMDQFISTMAEEGFCLLIDCGSLEAFSVPVDDHSIVFVIVNSNVRHELSGSEYSSRRSCCFEAASLMNKSSLRTATLVDVSKHEDQMSVEMVKRSRHVITEIDRTEKGVKALREKNYSLFGQLMTKSHESLRDDYEVSCLELDELVSIALSVPGVYGSRMTGGGFGGCTVSLVSSNSVENFIEKITKEYSGVPTIYVCSASGGAKVLSIETLLKC